jgi:hypothetical protein
MNCLASLQGKGALSAFISPSSDMGVFFYGKRFNKCHPQFYVDESIICQ